MFVPILFQNRLKIDSLSVNGTYNVYHSVTWPHCVSNSYFQCFANFVTLPHRTFVWLSHCHTYCDTLWQSGKRYKCGCHTATLQTNNFNLTSSVALSHFHNKWLEYLETCSRRYFRDCVSLWNHHGFQKKHQKIKINISKFRRVQAFHC